MSRENSRSCWRRLLLTTQVKGPSMLPVMKTAPSISKSPSWSWECVWETEGRCCPRASLHSSCGSGYQGSQPRDSQVQASSRETISDQLCPPSICPHLLPVQVLPIAVVVHCLRDLPPGRPGHPPALTSRTHSLSASCRWQQEAHARESCHQADQVIHLLSPHSSASCRWQQEPDDYNPISAIPNGDWTYQTQVSLLVAPVAGYTYTCSVQHVSLQEPLLEDGSEWRGAEPQPEAGGRGSLLVLGTGQMLTHS
uniref:Immunoglobulin C1-set domain-containing protein n=1 Tax=Anas platyrhynchos platyrhynchos TaxID=8840 RepID=A0A493TY57_ANAPP